MTPAAPALPAMRTPLTLEAVVAVAAAIEHTRGASLSIGESSTLKALYQQLVRTTRGTATVADVAAAVGFYPRPATAGQNS